MGQKSKVVMDGLTFDDVLLIPSRARRLLLFLLSEYLPIPIIDNLIEMWIVVVY